MENQPRLQAMNCLHTCHIYKFFFFPLEQKIKNTKPTESFFWSFAGRARQVLLIAERYCTSMYGLLLNTKWQRHHQRVLRSA